MEWQRMDSCPRGEDPVWLRMSDGTSFQAILVPVEGDDDTFWAWAEVNEGEAPQDWCDGICWAVNSHGVPSTQPVLWALTDREFWPDNPTEGM